MRSIAETFVSYITIRVGIIFQGFRLNSWDWFSDVGGIYLGYHGISKTADSTIAETMKVDKLLH